MSDQEKKEYPLFDVTEEEYIIKGRSVKKSEVVRIEFEVEDSNRYNGLVCLATFHLENGKQHLIVIGDDYETMAKLYCAYARTTHPETTPFTQLPYLPLHLWTLLMGSLTYAGFTYRWGFISIALLLLTLFSMRLYASLYETRTASSNISNDTAHTTWSCLITTEK